MKKIWIYRITSSGATMLELVFLHYLTLHYLSASGGIPFFDIRPVWDPVRLADITENLSPLARSIYDRMQLVDLLFPLFYTATLLVWVPVSRRKSYLLVAFIASGALCDYGENLIIHQLLHHPKSLSQIFLTVLPYITTIKFTCIIFSLCLIIMMYIRRAIRGTC